MCGQGASEPIALILAVATTQQAMSSRAGRLSQGMSMWYVRNGANGSPHNSLLYAEKAEGEGTVSV